MARNEAARIFDVEPPFECRFEQVAQLGDDRRRKPKPEQRHEPVRPPRKHEAEYGSPERAYDGPRPSLARRDDWPKPRSSDEPSGKIGSDIRSPNDREKP